MGRQGGQIDSDTTVQVSNGCEAHSAMFTVSRSLWTRVCVISLATCCITAGELGAGDLLDAGAAAAAVQ